MKNWNLIKEYSKMKSADDILKFEEEISKIVNDQNGNDLKNLIMLFDDECEFREVMYSLVHAIETYPRELYVKELLASLEFLLRENNFFWADCLFNRILNDSDYLDCLKKNIHIASKKNLMQLFELMKKESPHHKNLLKSILSLR